MAEHAARIADVLDAWVAGEELWRVPVGTDGLLLTSYGLVIGVTTDAGNRYVLHGPKLSPAQFAHALAARTVSQGAYAAAEHVTFECSGLCEHVEAILEAEARIVAQ
jgi:hypothetical protein